MRAAPNVLALWRVIAAGFCLVGALTAYALDPAKSVYQFNCQNWTRQNGLSANRITSVTQTKDGYLWLGTQNGLARFDGLEFKLVPVDAQGKLNQEIRQLVRSSDGGIWFANENGGFGHYDGKKFSLAGESKWARPDLCATAVFETSDRTLWVGTAYGWGQWSKERPGLAVLAENEQMPVLSFCEDPQGRIWRGTAEHGVDYWSGGKWVHVVDEFLDKRNVFALVADGLGQIWVGTERGLRCYSADAQLKEVLPLAADVRSLLFDHHGVLWIGTNGGGLGRYKDGQFTFLKKADGFGSDYVTCIFEDAEGSLWVGTQDGLSQLSDLKFPIYSNKEGISEGSSHVVFPARKGGLWACGVGLSWLSPTAARLYTEQEVPQLNQYLIGGLEAKNGDLYLADGDKRIAIFSGGKLSVIYSGLVWPRAFAEDAESVLVGIGDSLVRIIDGKLVPYSYKEGETPRIYWINNLTVSRDNNIWLATNVGVVRIKDGKCQFWTSADGLSSDKVNWINEDEDGSIWIGLNTGIARIKGDQLANIREEDGLADPRVYAIVPDDHGFFWIQSGRGIFRVSRTSINRVADRQAPRLECNVYDGLESVKFGDRTDQAPSGCKTNDGRIWFPNPQGVVMIDPQGFYINRVPPPVYVQQVRVNGKKVTDHNNARLHPGDKRLEFGFTALSYISPKKVQIRYQLVGFDSGWVDAGTRRSASYNYLRPGFYKFHVQACNADGVWNESGDTFSFELPLSFYETWWFKLLYILGVGGVLFGAYRWKVRHMEIRHKKLRAENDLLEAKVAKRTEELAREHGLLRALLDNSPDQIYFKDKESRYLKSSKAQAANFGVESPEMLIGKTDFDFFSPEHARPAFEDEQEIIRTGNPIIGKVEKEIWVDGRTSWVITSKMPLRNAAGEIVGTFGTSKNISAIKEAEAKLAQVHKELLKTSRQAGMAEVATSVLHNVGNVLNSVNVSSTLVTDRVRNSKVANVAKVGEMLRDHRSDLSHFLSADPRGQCLPDYLQSLAGHLIQEQQSLVAELESLCKNIEHIKDIVAMQQSYGKVAGVTEELVLTDLVDDAIRITNNSLERYGVTVIKEYLARPSITIDKHKVLQILVNLLTNARTACTDSLRTDKTIVCQVVEREDRVIISIKDNGVGIHPENLTRIFGHGFTTRKEGHGFGLHSGALAAKELGGCLLAFSDGPNQGATFVLELPLQAAHVLV